MPLATCPECEFEFVAADPFELQASDPEGMAVCPKCGNRFQPLAESKGDGKRRPTAMGGLQRSLFALLILLSVAVDGGGLALVGMHVTGPNPPRVPATLLLGVGLLGHGLASLAGLVKLWQASGLKSAVAWLRGALICWVAGAGVGLLFGAQLVGGGVGSTAMLFAAGGGLALVLIYLRALEWLAELADPLPESIDAVEPMPNARGAALALLTFNATLALLLAWMAWQAYAGGAYLGALFELGAICALGVYLVIGGGGIFGRTRDPVDAARALPRSAAALWVAVLLMAVYLLGPARMDFWPSRLAVLAMAADAVAVWICHLRLTPRAR
jgi:MFS family permease